MKNQRRKHTAEFKATVALEALKGMDTVSQIAAKHELHPVQVSNWKKELLEGAGSLFKRKNAKADKAIELERAHYQRKIGQLAMEVDFLEKSTGSWGFPAKGEASGARIPAIIAMLPMAVVVVGNTKTNSMALTLMPKDVNAG